MPNHDEILDKLTKTCRCKGVSRLTIKNEIKNGADTFEKVQQATKAGTGSCKGAGCKYIIDQLIENSKKDTD